MGAYQGFVYAAVLVSAAILLLAGAAALAWPPAHRVLTWIVTGFYLVTVLEVVTVLIAVAHGGVPVVMTVGYTLAALALLPLLGIGRMGLPDAAANEPGRPILQPDQIARVDGAAAVLVAVAAAVVAWRFHVILGSVS